MSRKGLLILRSGSSFRCLNSLGVHRADLGSPRLVTRVLCFSNTVMIQDKQPDQRNARCQALLLIDTCNFNHDISQRARQVQPIISLSFFDHHLNISPLNSIVFVECEPVINCSIGRDDIARRHQPVYACLSETIYEQWKQSLIQWHVDKALASKPSVQSFFSTLAVVSPYSERRLRHNNSHQL